MNTISTGRLVSLLGNWSSGSGSLKDRLAEVLRRLIDGGQLPPLTRLPSERALARALALSRTTVMSAYDQLKAEGYLASTQGSGTWVDARQPRQPGGDWGQQPFPWLHRLDPGHGWAASGSEGVVDLSAVALPALDMVWEEMTSVATEEWQAMLSVPGYFPLGLPMLRTAIAAHLSDRGMETSPEQIIVTTGAQQAINLVASLWLEPGDTVAIEDPTYAGALPVFRGAGAKIVPVEVDGDGIRTEMLEEVLAHEGVDLIYVNPTFHNPTGTVLSEPRRQMLASLVETSRALLVECEVLHDLSFTEELPPPSIASLNEDASVVTIGSMSGLFWSGLRIGWLRGPAHLVARLGISKAAADLGTSLVDQLIATRLLEHVDRARSARRESLGAGIENIARLLGEHLREWSWTTPAGGPSLWVRLHEGEAAEFAQVSARHGVLILPGPAFSVTDRCKDRLRLPFVMPEASLTMGMERLGSAWDEYRSRIAPR